MTALERMLTFWTLVRKDEEAVKKLLALDGGEEGNSLAGKDALQLNFEEFLERKSPQSVLPALQCRGSEIAGSFGALHQGVASFIENMQLTKEEFTSKCGSQPATKFAAAGGVGLLLVQMAKQRGARVFGTVSTEEKAKAARGAGADVVIRYTDEDFESVVKRETSGRGLDVVYDSVGKTTFEKSLKCLKPRGMLALYGQSSGPVAPFDPGELAKGGSLFLTRPTLAHYALDRSEVLARANDVLSWMAKGELDVKIDRTLPLGEAAEAHRLLEGRKTSGKLVLTV